MAEFATNALHYLRYRLGLDAAATQTTAAERELLGELAPGRKVIVELGVFEGVGSRTLRSAMDPDAELFCVDPFPVGRMGFSPQLDISKREIAKSSNGKVHLLRCFSFEAVKDWSRPIDFVYMDAEQNFEGVTRDFRDWSRFLRSGGLFLIHTSKSSPEKPVPADNGCVRLVNEVIATDPAFNLRGFVHSMAVVDKL